MNETDTALDVVRKLFERRLKVGKVASSRPERFFQLQAQAPQRYRTGMQVRVQTWRHWSEALAKFDAETGTRSATSLLDCPIRPRKWK